MTEIVDFEIRKPLLIETIKWTKENVTPRDSTNLDFIFHSFVKKLDIMKATEYIDKHCFRGVEAKFMNEEKLIIY